MKSILLYSSCVSGRPTYDATMMSDDYDLTINLLSEYVEKLDSQQQSFLYSYLPDSFGVLTTPQEITEDDFQNVRTFLKNYLQAGRFPGFGGKALAPQAASLCRDGLS